MNAAESGQRRRWSDEAISRLHQDFLDHREEFQGLKAEAHHFFVVTFPAHADAEDLRIERIVAAFPIASDGQPDYGGHRGAHEAQIAAKVAEREFYQQAKAELLKGGIRGLVLLVGLLVGLALYGLRAKLGILPP